MEKKLERAETSIRNLLAWIRSWNDNVLPAEVLPLVDPTYVGTGSNSSGVVPLSTSSNALPLPVQVFQLLLVEPMINVASSNNTGTAPLRPRPKVLASSDTGNNVLPFPAQVLQLALLDPTSNIGSENTGNINHALPLPAAAQGFELADADHDHDHTYFGKNTDKGSRSIKTSRKGPAAPSPESFVDSSPSSPASTFPSSYITEFIDLESIPSPNKEVRLHKCPCCPKEFDSISSLSQHEISHCSVRVKRLNPSNSRRSRARRRGGLPRPKPKPKPEPKRFLTCTECSERFTSTKLYGEHKKIHPQVHKCPTCSKTFGILSSLNTHVRFVHGEKPERVLCPKCGKVLSYSSLKRHMEAEHERLKVYTCKFCPKTFYRSQNLRQHEWIHLQERRQQCPHCGLWQSRNNYTKHIQWVHEGKRFKCNICGIVINISTRAHLLAKHLDVMDTVPDGEAFSVVYLDKDTLEARAKSFKSRQSRAAAAAQQETSDKNPPEEVEQMGGELVTNDVQIVEPEVPEYVTITISSSESESEVEVDESEIGDHYSAEPLQQNLPTVALVEEITMLSIQPTTDPLPTFSLVDVHALSTQPVKPVQTNEPIQPKPTPIPKRECHVCKKYYVHLEAHIELVHPSSKEVVYKCNFCDRGYNTAMSLYGHVRHMHILERGQLGLGPQPTRKRFPRKRYPRKAPPKVRPPRPKNPHRPPRPPNQHHGKRRRGKTKLLQCTLCEAKLNGSELLRIHLIRHQRDPSYRFISKRRVKIIGENEPAIDLEKAAENEPIIVTHVAAENEPIVVTSAAMETEPVPLQPTEGKKHKSVKGGAAVSGLAKPKVSVVRKDIPVDCPYADCVKDLGTLPALRQHFKDFHPDFDSVRRGRIEVLGGEAGTATEIKGKSPPVKAACHQCGKDILWYNMRRHIQDVHEQSRNFHCQVCNKSYQQKSILQLHFTTKIHKEREAEQIVQELEHAYQQEASFGG